MSRSRLVLVPDGMADEPLERLAGRTPLQVAHTPAMDALARGGVAGLVQTVPPEMTPGSDVANLSVLGYRPGEVYTGRSPLEAASIGVELGPQDVAYRCNFVTLADGTMRDHTAGHIATEQARALIEALAAAHEGTPFEFHTGVSYRHLMVWRGGQVVPCVPPHDILDRPVDEYLPPGEHGLVLRRVMRVAHEVLESVRPNTDIWLWGEGTAPRMPRFRDLYGLSGAVVSAVDLVRGIGVYAGLEVLEVPGATGDLATDYAAKARVALGALRTHDLVLVHVEAPDEASHMGSVEEKIRAIERVDARVLAPLWESAPRPAVLVLPDHATPIRTRTHAASPVPFAYAVPGLPLEGPAAPHYSESAAAGTGLTVPSGADLMARFLAATT
jgi:2,3-bisphosphoglycerate-independent phosphoglycerate mutase